MKIKNNTILCVFALITLAAGFGSCQSEDDKLGNLPAGSVPLVLGNVTVAGAQTVNTRAAGGNTRAAISENASGYTGIRKSCFVNGDVLNLTLSNGSGGSTTSVTATLTGGTWVLNPAKVFITPGVTEVSAAHTATEQIVGIATDDLAAANADCTLTTATGTLAIAMKHAGAMIDITPGATDGATITSVTVNADVPTVAEEESVASGSGTELHYRTLTADATTVSSISAVIGGTTYTATLATPIAVAANKRYPVALTFKHQTLTATPSAPQDWTNGGTVPVPGYTRIIDSPEALAQFAKDFEIETGENVVALQTADIDLSKLKPASEAGINPLTGTAYNYSATKDNWKGICLMNPFLGTYNGNGHTISNLKGEGSLFCFFGGTITGVHLRNVNLTAMSSLVFESGGFVSLCSVTGTINSGVGDKIGGLIGCLRSGSITRCSADVKITGSEDGAFYGGLIGEFTGGVIAGCMASGDVEHTGSNGKIGGLIGYLNGGEAFGCLATGNVTASGSSTGAFVGESGPSSSSIISCCATGTVGTASSEFIGNSMSSLTITDCVYTGTTTSTLTGVTGDVATDNLYATLTANNTSLADVETLHWSAADGYTLTEVTNTWYAKHLWIDNGMEAPTIDMAYEGMPLYNSLVPNLLAIPGQTAYYVAPEDAKNASGQLPMPWADTTADGVCPLGWHVPTKDEFVAMTGLTAGQADADTNNAAIVSVFPAGVHYWSSTEYGANAWYLYVTPSGTSSINHILKKNAYRMRCVRAK